MSYSSDRYVKWAVRKAVLERDKACVYCGEPVATIRDSSQGGPNDQWRAYDKDGRPFHFDHKIPFSQGGNSDETNIVLACADCNLKKAAKVADDQETDLPRVIPSRDGSKCPSCRAKGYRVLPWQPPKYYDPWMIKVVCRCGVESYIAPAPWGKKRPILRLSKQFDIHHTPYHCH